MMASVRMQYKRNLVEDNPLSLPLGGSAPLPEIGGIWGGIWRALSAIIPCGLPYNSSGPPPLSSTNHTRVVHQKPHHGAYSRPHQKQHHGAHPPADHTRELTPQGGLWLSHICSSASFHTFTRIKQYLDPRNICVDELHNFRRSSFQGKIRKTHYPKC